MTTWSSFDKSERINLSAGNLTASASANNQWIRATAAAEHGKWFFSVRISAPPRNPVIGFSNGGVIGHFVGSNTNAFGIFANGWGAINATYSRWGDAFRQGSVVDLAYDSVARRFWYRVDGSNWNGQVTADPAKGIGGHDVSLMSATKIIPVFGAKSGDACHANFGPTFAYALPVRFASFVGTAAPAPAPAPSPEAAPPPAPALTPTEPAPRYASKIGIGCWETKDFATLRWVETMKFGWYYNWRPDHMDDPSGTLRTVPFVPMIWGEKHINSTPQSGSCELLGFNEPDGLDMSHQSNLSVDKAISLWPKLMAHGLRLGSPAPMQHNTFGSGRWLTNFMTKAEVLGYRVDFMAVHYYSTNGRGADFENWLKQVHAAYKRPILITEWCLVDWSKPKAFTLEDNAQFVKDALPMLDALPFVEGHAWFAANPYDLFGAPTHLFDNNMNLTSVGRVFQSALA